MARTVNVNPLVSAVKGIELQEIRNLLKEKGGSFEFDDLCPPSVDHLHFSGARTSDVASIRIEKGNPKVILTIWDNYHGGYNEITSDDLYAGELISLAKYM
jgi:hypothetical protein